MFSSLSGCVLFFFCFCFGFWSVTSLRSLIFRAAMFGWNSKSGKDSRNLFGSVEEVWSEAQNSGTANVRTVAVSTDRVTHVGYIELRNVFFAEAEKQTVTTVSGRDLGYHQLGLQKSFLISIFTHFYTTSYLAGNLLSPSSLLKTSHKPAQYFKPLVVNNMQMYVSLFEVKLAF